MGENSHFRTEDPPLPGAPSFSRTLRKGWVMGIIGALYERGHCRGQQEIPRGRRPWNPTLQKTKGGAPGNPNPSAQKIAFAVPNSTTMNKKAISSTEFFGSLSELKTKSVPVLAVFVSTDRSVSKLYGFLASLTRELGLVICSTEGMPAMSSTLSVPVSEATQFFRELAADLPESDRERLETAYADTALSMVLSTGARLMIFFTTP